MKRMKRLKEVWEGFRSDNDTKGGSYLNIGRMPLSWYLDYCYSKYKELCYCCGEVVLPFSKWLYEDDANLLVERIIKDYNSGYDEVGCGEKNWGKYYNLGISDKLENGEITIEEYLSYFSYDELIDIFDGQRSLIYR